jgi:hypothetical protein
MFKVFYFSFQSTKVIQLNGGICLNLHNYDRGAKKKQAIKKIIARPLARRRLLPQAEFLYNFPVTLNFVALQKVKLLASFTNQGNQSSLCKLIFLIGFKMLRQVLDAMGEKSYLAFSHTCIFFRTSVGFENIFLDFRS